MTKITYKGTPEYNTLGMSKPAAHVARPDGAIVADYFKYVTAARKFTKDQLEYAIRDASEAAAANPDGIKAQYYRDEVAICENILLVRRVNENMKKSRDYHRDAANAPRRRRAK